MVMQAVTALLLPSFDAGKPETTVRQKANNGLKISRCLLCALYKFYFPSQHFYYLVQQVDATVTFLPFDAAVIVDRDITALGNVVLGKFQFLPQPV